MIEIRTPTAPVETVTPIKPSEALRLGRLTRPTPCSGETLKGTDMACAMGAMAVGWGYSGHNESKAWDLAFHRLYEIDADLPRAIWTRFDELVWTGDPDPDAAVLAVLTERGL